MTDYCPIRRLRDCSGMPEFSWLSLYGGSLRKTVIDITWGQGDKKPTFGLSMMVRGVMDDAGLFSGQTRTPRQARGKRQVAGRVSNCRHRVAADTPPGCHCVAADGGVSPPPRRAGRPFPHGLPAPTGGPQRSPPSPAVACSAGLRGRHNVTSLCLSGFRRRPGDSGVLGICAPSFPRRRESRMAARSGLCPPRPSWERGQG